MTKLYLAGPMRGYPDLNFAAFDHAADRLRLAGYEVFNPADHDRAHPGIKVRECFKADTSFICDEADGLAVLTGWEDSLGAKAEVALAAAIGIPVNFWAQWVSALVAQDYES